jgi:hypothetical protein
VRGDSETRTQSGLRSTADGERLRHESRQGLHRKHPRCTVNLPNMVESSNSKRGRRATEGAKLTGARRRCRAAPVVGEVVHASGSYSKVIGCSSHASGSCSGVGAPGPAVSGARGVDKIHRGGPFYSHTLHWGGGQRGPAQGERLRGDGSAQRQSRQALARHRAQRG